MPVFIISCAVNLKVAEFMNGPLGGHALLNDSALMQKQLEFNGIISKIAIAKLFRRVSDIVSNQLFASPCGSNL